MGDEIKSTWEIVKEKLDKIGKADPENLKIEKVKEEASRVCAKFIFDPTTTWEDTVARYLTQITGDLKKQALKTCTEVFLKNIVLPRMEGQLENSKRSLEGLQKLFKNLPEISKLMKEAETLLTHYLNQRKRLYEELKKRYSGELSNLERALSNSLGLEVKVQPEQHPQFQEDWKKVSEHLDDQAERQLEHFRHIVHKIVE